MSLGTAELVSTLVTKGFEKSLDTLKKRTIADFKIMSAAAEGVLGGKGFPSAGAPPKALTQLETAAKSLTVATKALNAEQKAGLVTQDQALAKLRSLTGEYAK